MARIDSISKAFDPNEAESRLYQKWTSSGYFKPKAGKTGKKFSIVMPPPNITGQLHMGHALDNTLQDTLTRYKRMSGYETLWVPGTDHASIATEARIVATMREEGLTKDDLGRDKFLERAWAWKEQYGGRIVEQLKKIGSSCDWSHERFTMDEGCSDAVKEVFVKYYNQGLIYRGERIINWCPHCLTSISNAEVDYADQAGHFWHLRYPFEDGSGYIDLATTRPETLLGDTAVAVNALDDRYKDYKKADLVYIDPPYNTGNKDFIYDDAFVDVNDTFRHSKWLSFMEKRLSIAKKLLTEVGIILLSINDNECSDLKLLCDSIFGTENFVENFIWVKNSGGSLSKTTLTRHEYILCYAKNIELSFNMPFYFMEKPGYQNVVNLISNCKEKGRDYLVLFYSSISLK